MDTKQRLIVTVVVVLLLVLVLVFAIALFTAALLVDRYAPLPLQVLSMVVLVAVTATFYIIELKHLQMLKVLIQKQNEVV